MKPMAMTQTNTTKDLTKDLSFEDKMAFLKALDEIHSYAKNKMEFYATYDENGNVSAIPSPFDGKYKAWALVVELLENEI